MTELFLLTLYLEPPHSMLANQRNIFLLETNSVCLLSYSQSLLCLKQTFFRRTTRRRPRLFISLDRSRASCSRSSDEPILPQLRHCFEEISQASAVAPCGTCARCRSALFSVPHMPHLSFCPVHLSELHHLLCQCHCPHCRSRGEGSLGVSQPSRPHGVKHARVCY